MEGDLAKRRSQRLALEASQVVGAWSWDIDKDRILLDRSLAALFLRDIDPPQLGISLFHFLSLIHRDDRERIRSSVSKSLANGSVFEEVYRVPTDDDKTVWVRSKGQCHFAQEDTPAQMIGFTVEAIPGSSSIHASIVDRLVDARTLSIAADETLLTKLIEAVLLEAGERLATTMKDAQVNATERD